MVVYDKFANTYDEGHVKAVAMSGFTPDYFHDYKLKEVVRYLKKNKLTNKKINFLDFGCGIGRSADYVRKYLSKALIWGVDVSKEEIKIAQKNNKKYNNVKFTHFDGFKIPFEKKFDVIFVSCVFHHVKRSNQRRVMKELFNKLSDNGVLFIFEHNPINPLTQWIYYKNDYQFDKNARLLSPFYTRKLLKNAGFLNTKINYAIFFPSFLSRLIKYEKYLSWLPLGAHYYYIAKKALRHV